MPTFLYVEKPKILLKTRRSAILETYLMRSPVVIALHAGWEIRSTGPGATLKKRAHWFTGFGNQGLFLMNQRLFNGWENLGVYILIPHSMRLVKLFLQVIYFFGNWSVPGPFVDLELNARIIHG